MGRAYNQKCVMRLMVFYILCNCCIAAAQSESEAQEIKSATGTTKAREEQITTKENPKGAATNKEKPDVWGIMGKWGTIAVTAITAAYSTFLFGIRLERRKRQRELKNIRSILLQEMKWNCKELMKLTPFDGDPKKQTYRAVVAEQLSMLSSSVYGKYLDKLCGLKEEEIRSVYELYVWVQYYAEQGKKDVKKNATDDESARYRQDTAILFDFCNKLVYRFFETIKLLENGTEGLYDLMNDQPVYIWELSDQYL